MKNKVIFIIPYFGKLPKGFQCYLNTCKSNKDIDFLIFTNDETKFICPDNVKIEYKSFEEIKKEIQNNFDFKISLNRPYKLCDFRPAYGLIFEQYISKYDFWGYCDMDLLWGDISKFYNDEILDKYDHLGIWGHCQLFRNKKEINEIFMIEDEELGVNYREVYSNDMNYGFDEIPINKIFSKYIENNYFKMNFANLNKYDYSFHLVNYIPEEDYKNKYQVFEYINGKLLRHYVHENKVYTEEYCYLHLWCRPITFKIKNKLSNHYFIYPEVVTDKEIKVDVKTIKRKSRKNPFRYYFKSIWMNRKKITLKRIIFNIKGMIKYKKGIGH